MDPRYSGQDVVHCNVCETTETHLYCNVCHIHLCKDCVEKHLSSKVTVHNVVSLKQFLATPKCVIHPTKQCDLHCEECDTPICTLCVSSKQHKHHDVVGIMDNYRNKQEFIKKDLEELEKTIFPKYEKAASDIPTQKKDMSEYLQILTTAVIEHGDIWHRTINAITERMQSEIDSMSSEYLAVVNEQESEINRKINEISKNMTDIRKLLSTGDICLVSRYISRNEEFKKMPPKLKVSIPYFQPQKISKENILQQFGAVSPLIIRKELSYILPSGAMSYAPSRPLVDIPYVIRDFTTEYEYLYNVSCLNDKEVWTRGDKNAMKLYNLQGQLLKSVETKSGNYPRDITVKKGGGELVYIDYKDRSLNVVSGTQIQPLITLQGWRPRGLCNTSSGDLLVIMNRDDDKQTKVVRYSGSTEKQQIQWDHRNQPLYSSGEIKCLTENRNLDVCVADHKANAVVVVSADGGFRFRYTGRSSSTKDSFCPYGITSDSQGRILSTDWERYNYRIHIIDQDGHFLRYIENCGLCRPMGLCVDSRDNLFVAERDTSKVQKIRYCT